MKEELKKCLQCLYSYTDIEKKLKCAHTEVCEAYNRFIDKSKYYS